MENEGNKIIAYLGYVIALLSPLLGLIYGAILFFWKKEVPLYRKHGRYTIYFAIAAFIVYVIILYAMGGIK